jgi:hypothetical protein
MYLFRRGVTHTDCFIVHCHCPLPVILNILVTNVFATVIWVTSPENDILRV